jgi:type II secretory pathway pseudopilin PulG
MMFHKLRLINKNQIGLTMLELMVAFAISGIITTGVTMTFYQVVTGSIRTNNHMTAVKHVQDAGYWFSHDAQAAQSVTLGPSSGFDLTLSWIDWSGVTNTVTYSLVDMGGGLKKLNRHLVAGTTTTDTVVAQYIDGSAQNTNVTLTNSMLTLTITATVGSGSSQQQSETRVYQAVPRPSL